MIPLLASMNWFWVGCCIVGFIFIQTAFHQMAKTNNIARYSPLVALGVFIITVSVWLDTSENNRKFNKIMRTITHEMDIAPRDTQWQHVGTEPGNADVYQLYYENERYTIRVEPNATFDVLEHDTRYRDERTD